MKTANGSLDETVKATSALLKSRKQAADVRPLIDSVNKQIDQINSAPRVDAQSDQYRKRLLELLAAQKRILDEFEKESAKDWKAHAGEEEDLSRRYGDFVTDYDKWLPGFLKEHGYELGQSK